MSDQREDPVGNALRGIPSATPLEKSLAAFAPAPARLDRDRLMFLAGQASVPQCRPLELRVDKQASHWLWPASTATLAATSLALAMALFTRPMPQPQFIVQRPQAPVPPTEAVLPRAAADRQQQPSHYAAVATRAKPPAGDSYLKTRDVALRMGLDALGAPGAGDGLAPATTYWDLLEGLAAPAAAANRSPERSSNM